jgi:hypothetical protein
MFHGEFKSSFAVKKHLHVKLQIKYHVDGENQWMNEKRSRQTAAPFRIS